MILAGFLSDMQRVALAGLTAFAVTYLLTPLVRLTAIRYGQIASPVEDRWGRRVIARLGGVAMFAGFFVSILLWVPLQGPVVGLLIGGSLVFGLGLFDDLLHVAAYSKLVGQLLIGSVIVMSGIRLSLPWEWCAVPLSVIWFVLVMNAFNLLDNMDGLAAGIGAIAAGFCALHTALQGQWALTALASIIGGACLGFLCHNFPPAKIFMGDSGSQLLGLSLSIVALMGRWRHSTQLLSVLAIPTLVLAVPIFDTCFVTVQRLLHRRSPFVGGTDHVSHRLAILGLSVRQTVVALYGISACFGLIGIFLMKLKPLPTLAVWVSVMTALVLFGRYLSKVDVYRVEERPVRTAQRRQEPADRPTTLIETMLLHKRRLLEILIDFCLISSVYVFAHLLRFEGALSGDLQLLIVKSLPVILVIKLMVFAAYGLYRGVWRYLGLADLIAMVKAVTVGSVLSSLVLLYVWRFEGFSRSVLVIDWMLTLLAVGGSRILERLLDEWVTEQASHDHPVLIFGAGDTGASVLRSLKYQGKEGRHVVGLLDDDVAKHGTRILGVPVLGGRTKLLKALKTYQVREVLIAITDPPGSLLEYIRAQCEGQGTTWKVVTAGIANA